ncbi:MAG: hypothetical protein H0V92_04030 [Pseudonocardiales bacterium]|nr:hypothetical protein [Pseudonocardiales bacterium]
MPDTAGWVAPRLLSVGAVLIGLFVMHGLPAGAGGCHGGLCVSLAPRQVVAGWPGSTVVLAAQLDRFLTDPQMSAARDHWSSRRGPPLAGAVLLTRVGISLI